MYVTTVEPTTNIMTPSRSEPIIAGNSETFTCTTNNFNPLSSFVAMRWRRGNYPSNGGLDQTDDTSFTLDAGENDIRRVISTYTFVAGRTDNGAYVSCVPIWNDGSGGGGLTRIRESQQMVVYCMFWLCIKYSVLIYTIIHAAFFICMCVITTQYVRFH